MKTIRQALPTLYTSLSAGGLILLVGGLAAALEQPWLFPSLGPTAALLVLHPGQRASRTWNTIAGHGIGVLAGVLAARLSGAAALGSALPGSPKPEHVLAAAAATALTLAGGRLLDAEHPPAAATTLLLALGAIPPDTAGTLSVGAGVLLLCSAGAPLRRRALQDITKGGGQRAQK